MQDSNWNLEQNIAYAPNDLTYTEFSTLFYSRTNKEWVLVIYSNQITSNINVQDFLSNKHYYLSIFTLLQINTS